MACSILCSVLVVVTAVVIIGTARAGSSSGDHLTAGFTRVSLPESKFVVQKPYNVPLDARYEFAGGVRRMWAYSTDKPMSATHHDLRRVLAGGVYDRWLRLNVVHDVGARNVTVFVDGAEVLRSRSHGAPGAPHYFKFGVYKQSHHHPSDRMESRWRNVRVFTKH